MLDEEKTLNQRVEDFLKFKHISQQELAKHMGVSRQQVTNWLSGNNEIPAKHIIKLFATYETLNPRWLLDGTGEMEGTEQALPAESLLMTKKDTTIELLTQGIRERDALIMELLKEIGRLEEKLSSRKS